MYLDSMYMIGWRLWVVYTRDGSVRYRVLVDVAGRCRLVLLGRSCFFYFFYGYA